MPWYQRVFSRIYPRSSSQAGFVAVAAIAFSGIVMAIAMEFSTVVRLATIRASVDQDYLKTIQIADGMARLTAWRIATGKVTVFNGTTSACRWDTETRVEITVQDSGGLIDINLAPQALLEDIFERLGEAQSSARTIAEAIIDYRDADTVAPSGVEEATGQKLKNRPFETVEELEAAARLSEDLYRKAKPLFTVSSFQTGVDPDTAPQNLRDLLAEPNSGLFTGVLAPYTTVSQKKSFHLLVRAQLNSGKQAGRTATISVLRQPEKPFAVLTWNEGEDRPEAIDPAKSTRPCING
jgi:type II secretory pathway component PulK